ncbi:MAG: SDR family oxidoreductase [Candidatus Paceibacterota bacterium]
MKTVVITGVSKGLGKDIATAFLTIGWKVVGTGRSARPQDLDGRIEYHQFDASDAASAAKCWETVSDDHVCLVNNAASYAKGGLLETEAEEYERQMRSGYLSAVQMTRALASRIPTAKIINIISSSALEAHSRNSAYGAAKAATMHFFQSIQKEFEPEKYQITNLYPSDIATHGPNADAIDPKDLAAFVVQLAESPASYYLPDVTLRPIKRK